MEKILEFLSKNSFKIVIILVIIYFVLFSVASCMRHITFHSSNDLSVFDQKMWNTLNGRFYLTIEGGETHYQHMDYFILLLLPIYALFPSPLTLVVTQVFFVSLGCIGIFLLTKEILKKNLNIHTTNLIALAIAISYLLYPALQHSILIDYHSVVLAIPLIIFGFYFLEKNSKWSILLFSLSMFCNESVTFLIVLTSLYILIFRKNRNIGLPLLIISLTWFIVGLNIWFPSDYVCGQTYFESYGQRYNHLGNSSFEVIKNIVKDPIYAFSYGNITQKKNYIIHLFAPHGFVSFLSPETLVLCSTSFFINIFGKNEWQYSIFGQHYAAILVPFIFISVVYALERIRKFFGKKILYIIVVIVLISSIISFFSFGLSPIKVAEIYKNDYENNKEYHNSLKEILNMIPNNTTVFAQYHLTSHLTKKGFIYRYREQFRNINGSFVFGSNTISENNVYPKYGIIDLNKPIYPLEDDDYLLLFDMLKKHNYTLKYNIDDIYLFERK